jgi:adenylate cyclase
MSTGRLTILILGLMGAIWLFASAPPPLEAAITRGDDDRSVETRRLFDALDAVNGAARAIYTARIVGGGQKAGLAFGEDWAEPGVDKGPLPALLLRAVAANLEAKPPRVGLYLGSDQPINASNLFTGQGAAAFALVRQTRRPVYSTDPVAGQVALYPDLAAADPCVTCHNDHPDSPKTDWQLGDVMGATTWTYPDGTVGAAASLDAIEALYQAIGEAYDAYLARAAGFAEPPVIGADWPEAGRRVLPARAVFMAAVRQASAGAVLDRLVLVEAEGAE